MSDDFLSDEDKALFRKMAGDVKPLQYNKKVDFIAEKPRVPAAKSQDVFRPQNDPEIYLSDYYTDEVQANTLLSYSSPSIPHKRFRELKSGQIKWESRLDLHGLRPEAAKDALINYIFEQTALTHRCLLIIHGKGSYNGEPPILKNLVNHWLRQFPQVLAFYSALGRDGGSGALYVLLKRQRER
ncbi:Smr/MutS family protein [Legionella hackeliae]|uniref:Smr domain protein, DNA mismatch repair protein-like protein n=1 Tax=Legionella hackeliae TaxID=449 RepID=A0A0A8UM30_LEGHA|nr:Smr/MutS family protein [Legionella hackeliae]KTD10309.1 DNA mismatch repair protein-like protein [Legionella hackeliae]CEK09808.1 Smr domain protein, DNA mismatch repair protein-like protein [Legionella hackeliae]STX49717.1 Smr domain protein, DNA mismatch repair protein-like protein [Legionella hackeliae]